MNCFSLDFLNELGTIKISAWVTLLRRHVMIYTKIFSPEIKTMSSSLIKSIYIMISFLTFINLSIGKAKYEKGKFSVHWGLNR